VSLNIANTEATSEASADRISDPKMNHTSRPIRPPVASEPNRRPNTRRSRPPSSRMAMMVNGFNGLRNW